MTSDKVLNEILDAIDVSAGKQIGTDTTVLDLDANLFELGLTSIGFISMIVEFEQRFEIVFEEDELELSHFNSIEAISKKIDLKLNGERVLSY